MFDLSFQRNMIRGSIDEKHLMFLSYYEIDLLASEKKKIISLTT